MDKEIYNRVEVSNPNYQRGQEFGSQALDPLLALQETGDLSVVGRKEFLAGFAVGLEKFLLRKGITLPIGTTDLKINIDFPPFLLGITLGLRRVKPTTPPGFEFRDNGNPEDPLVWEDTLTLVSNISKGDGYMLGFLASLARDYGIITNGHEVPANNTQYQVYLDGSTAEPSEYFLIKGDKSLGPYAPEEYNKRIYLTGLKVWLYEQGIAMAFAPQITHPKTLKAFKEVVLTGNATDSEEQSPEAQAGYQLARKALSEKFEKNKN